MKLYLYSRNTKYIALDFEASVIKTRQKLANVYLQTKGHL